MTRCPTVLAALAAGLILAADLMPARAQSNTPYYTQDYTLTIPSTGIPLGDPTATTPELLFTNTFANTPGGAIVAPPDSSNPMTILPDSVGYTPAGSTTTNSPYVIIDLLKPDGSQFGLSFFANPDANPVPTTGLTAGDVFHVALDINQALQSDPPTLVSNLPGVSLVPDAAPQSSTSTSTSTTGSSTTSGSSSPQASETPEPLSVLVWSALSGIGLWYARLRRTCAPAF